MHDAPPDSPEDALMRDALLYVAGELDAESADAFEARLGDEQAARDALASAVELTLIVAEAPRRPDPAYRAAVRERLIRRGPFAWLTTPRVYAGHPAFWAGCGALAMAAVAFLPGLSTPRELPVVAPEVLVSDAPAAREMPVSVAVPPADAALVPNASPLVRQFDPPVPADADDEFPRRKPKKPREAEGPESIVDTPRVASPSRPR